MKQIKFTLNDDEWEIVLVPQIDGNPEIFGQTEYRTQTIYIQNSLKSTQQIKTLVHELMHCWLWEYGHRQCDNNTFHYEEVCDIIAASHSWIKSIIKEVTS